MGWWRGSVCQQGCWKRGRGVKEREKKTEGEFMAQTLSCPAVSLLSPPNASQCFPICFVAGHATPLPVFIWHHEGFRLPPIRWQPKPFRVHTQANSADDKAPLSLSAEPHGSQHALPSARHLPGLAPTQPRRPPHYSLWQGFMTQQLCPDLFGEHVQMLESVAMALLSNWNWLRGHLLLNFYNK